MTKEELIEELKKLRQERLDDLMKINAKHDMLIEFIANLNYIIAEATITEAESEVEDGRSIE